MNNSQMTTNARVAVIIPCYNDGEFVRQAAASVEEEEPVEIVIVDDGSTDASAIEAIDELGATGFEVVRLKANAGLSAARMAGLAATTAPYVFPLDSDDLVIPGALAAMADALEASDAAACVGDYAEFGDRELIRAVPLTLDPYRITYTNEYSATALYRRTALEEVGGWTARETYEDWDMWMSFAERGFTTTHLGPNAISFLRRVHLGRLGASFRAQQAKSYQRLQESHQALFAAAKANRRNSTLSRSRRALYPVIYGSRRRLGIEAYLKRRMDELGVWTLTRTAGPAEYSLLTHSRLAELALNPDFSPPERKTTEPRVCVVIPCFNDGEWIEETIASVREREPVEVVVVDDASTDPGTQETLKALEASGVRVIHQETNQGVSATRMRGLAESKAPLIVPLDADDLAMPRMLGLMADAFDADPELDVCYGDYAEFGDRELIRAVPEQLDPFRVAFTNEYPPSAMFRRSSLEAVGGWRRLLSEIDARSDWALWMSLAEAGAKYRHMGPRLLTYGRRMHPNRLSIAGRKWHQPLYVAMKERHQKLFEEVESYRGASPMQSRRKALYPIVYGGRRRFGFEPKLKRVLDNLGIWTLRR